MWTPILTASLTLALFSSTAASAQKAAGNWSGGIDGHILSLVQIQKSEDGHYQGTFSDHEQPLSYPDLHAIEKAPLENIQSVGDHLTFAVPAVGGLFDGQWDSAQKAWVGSFQWGKGGYVSHLTLAQTDAKNLSQTTLGSEPNAVLMAGSKILAFDKDAKFWERDAAPNAIWHPVPIEPDDPAYSVANLICSTGDDGLCVVKILTKGKTRTWLYSLNDGTISDLSALDGNNAVTFDGKDRLYATGPIRGKTQSAVYLYAPAQKTLVKIGELQPDEGLFLAKIDNQTHLLAGNTGNNIFRGVVAADAAITFSMSLPQGSMWSDDGPVVPEWWAIDHPRIPENRGVSLLTLHREGSGKIRVDSKLIGAWSINAPALPNYTLASAIDQNNDIVAELIGPTTHALGIMCTKPDGKPGFRPFAHVDRDGTETISASRVATGFLIGFTNLSQSTQYVRVEPSPSAHGFEDRKCADTTFKFMDIGVPVERNTADFETITAQATSADGTKVPYYILKPKGSDPEHLIIDAYGAFGIVRTFSYYQPATFDLLKETKTAIAFPVIRGDGNLGYAYAFASRTPNRGKSVEDIVAVTADLTQRFPGVKDKPVIRGESAGGWLAVKAVMTRPDLYSGAIGLSGAYVVKDTSQATGNYAFFSPDDDLGNDPSKLKAICPKMKFRFLQAKDDPVVHYDGVKKFADTLKSFGCPVDLVTFDTGGHAIDVDFAHQDDAKRKFQAYFDPF